MAFQTSRYTTSAAQVAAAAKLQEEQAAAQGFAAQSFGNPLPGLSKVPGGKWLRNHWVGVAAAVAVLPLFGVVAWVRNSEAEYNATGKQSALWGHPSTWLPSWLGGHASVSQPSLITDDKQYAALIHDYPDLALNPNDPPEIRTLKIGAINAHWKAKLQAEQDAATVVERKVISGRADAQAEIYNREMTADELDLATAIYNKATMATDIVPSGSKRQSTSSIQIYEIDKQSEEYVQMSQGLPVHLGQFDAPARLGVDPKSHLSVQDTPSFSEALKTPQYIPPSSSFEIFKYYNKSQQRPWSLDRNKHIIVPVVVHEPNDNVHIGFISEQNYNNLGFPSLNNRNPDGSLKFHTDPDDAKFRRSGQ